MCQVEYAKYNSTIQRGSSHIHCRTKCPCQAKWEGEIPLSHKQNFVRAAIMHYPFLYYFVRASVKISLAMRTNSPTYSNFSEL